LLLLPQYKLLGSELISNLASKIWHRSPSPENRYTVFTSTQKGGKTRGLGSWRNYKENHSLVYTCINASFHGIQKLFTSVLN
jgi:hypothetical protein